MGHNSDRIQKSLKKFARGLLATTCLTALAGVSAKAVTITEPPELSHAFPGTVFNVGTDGVDVVNGQLGAVGDTDDYIQLTGLLGNAGFTLTGNAQAGLAQMAVFSSSNSQIVGLTFMPATVSGTVPGDGILVLQAHDFEVAGNYSLTLTAAPATAPEPSTVAGVGLALAGALAWRRRKQNQ
jgi:hypothetical protein